VKICCANLCARLLGVMGVADRHTQAPVEPGAIQDYFAGMDGLNRVERNGKIASVLDVDDDFRAAMRGHLTDRAKVFAAVRRKRLKANFDFICHVPLRFN